MNIIKAFTPATLVLAMALAPLPAAAQSRPRAGGDNGGRAVERGSRTSAGAQARQESRSSAGERGGVAVAGGGGATVRSGGGGVVARGGDAVRGNAAPREQNYAVPRQRPSTPPVDARHGYAAPQYYGHSSHGYGYPYHAYGHGPYHAPHFDHPYYTFRPHTHIGFGLWIGFGVPYPYAYVAMYPPPVWGYYGGSFCIVPGAHVYGGISFDIAPAYAPVYVDGTYIGIASDFGPYAQPLTLVPGPHRVMISVGGYRPISWNVNIVAGQVIPFRGTMAAY